MDYLNYGKQVQQQPKKPQPQGFGNQVQLTKNDFSFGDLKQQTTKPQVVPQTKETKDELMQLFPSPILISSYPFDYGRELEWINKQPNKKQNEGAVNRQSEDSYILDNPEMSRVRQFIELKLKEFVHNVMGSDSQMVITQSWFNKSKKGESHHEHMHPNSIISGVWYPQIHEKMPPIKFRIAQPRQVSLHIKKYNNFNSSTYMLPLKMGELIIFSSDLQHSVPVNESNEERISLSFNTWVKGSLGDKERLTYLPLDRCV